MSSKFINLYIKNDEEDLKEDGDAVIVQKSVRVSDISSVELLSDNTVSINVIDSGGDGEFLTVDMGYLGLLREISELSN